MFWILFLLGPRARHLMLSLSLSRCWILKNRLLVSEIDRDGVLSNMWELAALRSITVLLLDMSLHRPHRKTGFS